MQKLVQYSMHYRYRHVKSSGAYWDKGRQKTVVTLLRFFILILRACCCQLWDPNLPSAWSFRPIERYQSFFWRFFAAHDLSISMILWEIQFWCTRTKSEPFIGERRAFYLKFCIPLSESKKELIKKLIVLLQARKSTLCSVYEWTLADESSLSNHKNESRAFLKNYENTKHFFADKTHFIDGPISETLQNKSIDFLRKNNMLIVWQISRPFETLQLTFEHFS